MKILTLPDGSAVDASIIAGITWHPAYSDTSSARVVVSVHGSDMFSTARVQHFCSVEYSSAEAAETACRELVAAWTGTVAEAQP